MHVHQQHDLMMLAVGFLGIQLQMGGDADLMGNNQECLALAKQLT
jgi:hypothetical protein